MLRMVISSQLERLVIGEFASRTALPRDFCFNSQRMRRGDPEGILHPVCYFGGDVRWQSTENPSTALTRAWRLRSGQAWH